ncbi:hypothetical protein S7711_10686 [Stachybotrys chartarum IBT 7711]|uniref:Uncharacterized protein n=1 Tax=Stachybotrys chartarum (strain CBS 109288 / IBT 7711) TaxID=1280523 RepID=A0A084AZN6_STACB|nr:hypothetical protein S7711_10686 [Stachybotrys chartarum IBT 7711]KFA50972.1 hypothetical protein S40293_10627 [Stachybotrys chartarum IBT 40293]
MQRGQRTLVVVWLALQPYHSQTPPDSGQPLAPEGALPLPLPKSLAGLLLIVLRSERAGVARGLQPGNPVTPCHGLAEDFLIDSPLEDETAAGGLPIQPAL